MRTVLARSLHAARARVEDDLRSDPALRYILLLSLLLTAFWFWHRLPNFATRDERWRVVDPVEVLAAVAEDPRYESVQEGVTYWRSYGATFYVSALVLGPVLALAILLGDVEGFLAMGEHRGVNFWRHWLRTPGWIWTASVGAARLAVVAFAVGSVYLVYRIGTELRDRATGRLSALLFSFTWGFLVLSHEVGEDVPALFCFLLAFYLALRYVETGRTTTFYWGCVAGGLAAALKLNAGVAALVLGGAFLLRAGREDGPWMERYLRPRFLAVGVGIGAVTILLGYPTVVAGEPGHFGARISRGVTNKADPHGWRVEPGWWWLLRGYLHGFGLPLAVGAGAGVLASLTTLTERTRAADGVRLALLVVGVLLVVYSRWAYVRMHHLLLVFPLFVLLLGVMGTRLYDWRPRVARPLLALLLVSSAVYSVGGVLGYAAQPRDQSTAFLAERADANTTVETYVYDPQEVGVPHDVTVYRPTDRTMTVEGERRIPGRHRWIVAVAERCPEFVVLNYHNSLLYLAPDSWGARADSLSAADLEMYFSDLLAEDTYAYEVAERFGRRPRFLDGQERRPTWRAMLYVGTRPRTMQYGDPQDMGVDQYTIVLERTGECDPEANSPFR